jgi:DNA-3-methyladenine glycosylase II
LTFINTYTSYSLHPLCDDLARSDARLQGIIDLYGYPPLWIRPNTYETLVLTILEQQVSLASAFAAYKKLKEQIDPVTPQKLLGLSDETLRACYLTRQKMAYTRILAEAILSKEIDLEAMALEEDEAVREKLIRLKGIGNWTIDIYLLHALQRTDIFPLGDLALLNAVRMVFNNPSLTKEEIGRLGEAWKPYRSIATMLFWHYYIQKKNIKLLH